MCKLPPLRKQKVHPNLPSASLPSQVTLDTTFVRVNGWSRPLHPLQLCAWFFLLFFAVSYFFLLIPHLPSLETRWIAGALNGLVFTFHLIVYILSTSVNPADDCVRKKYCSSSNSKVKPAKFDRTLHNHVIENQFCYICEVSVSGKAKHCSACNKCVSRFDHHCKWLNNCVGDKNYKLFVACVSSALVGSVIICALSTFFVIAFFSPSSWLHSPSHLTSQVNGDSNYSSILSTSRGDLLRGSSSGSTTALTNYGNSSTSKTFSNSSNSSSSNNGISNTGRSEQLTNIPTKGLPESLDEINMNEVPSSITTSSSSSLSFKNLYWPLWISTVILTAIFSLVSSFLLGHLLFFHIYLYFAGLSTYEFIVKKREEKNVEPVKSKDKMCKCNCLARLIKCSSCGKRKKEKQNLKSKCQFMLRVICCCCCYVGPERVKSQMPPAYKSKSGEGHSDQDKVNHCDHNSNGDHIERRDIVCISSNHFDQQTIDDLNASQLYYEPPERGQVMNHSKVSENDGQKSIDRQQSLWMSDSQYIHRFNDSGNRADSVKTSTNNSLHGDVYIGSPEKRLAQELDVIMNRSQGINSLVTSSPVVTSSPLSYHQAAFTSSVKNMIPFVADVNSKVPHESFISSVNSRLSNGRPVHNEKRGTQVNRKILTSNVPARDLKRIASVDSSLPCKVISSSSSSNETQGEYTWPDRNTLSEQISSSLLSHVKNSLNGPSNLSTINGRRHFVQKNGHRHHGQSLLSSSMSKMNQMNNYHSTGEHKRHKFTLLRQRSLDQMHQQLQQRNNRQVKMLPMPLHDQLCRDETCEEKSHENQLSFTRHSESSCKDQVVTESPANQANVQSTSSFDKHRQHSVEPVSDGQRSSDQTSMESEPFSPSPRLATPSRGESVTFTY